MKNYKNDLRVLVFFSLLSGIVGILLGPDEGWDFSKYHLYSPYAFLTGRIGFDIFPANVQSYFNPLPDVPYYLMVKYLNNYPRLIVFLQAQYYAAAAFLIYKISDLFFRQKGIEKILLVVTSVLISITGVTMIREIGMTHNDIPPAVLILAAIYIMLKYLFTAASSKRTKWLFLAGFLVGLAGGLKLTNVTYILSEFFVLCVLCRKYEQPAKILGFNLLGLVAGFLLADGWWMWILYSKFGSPLFPYYNAVFHSPWVVPENFKDGAVDINFMQFLFYPFYFFKLDGFAGEYMVRDLRPGFAYIAVLITLFVRTAKSGVNRNRELFIVWFVIISYFVWVKSFAYFRYSLPIQCLAGLVIIVALTHIKSILPNYRNRLHWGLVCSTTLLILLTTANVLVERAYKYKDKLLPIDEDFGFPDNAVVLLLETSPSALHIVFQNPNARYIGLPRPEDKDLNSGFEVTEQTKNTIKTLVKNNKGNVYVMYLDEQAEGLTPNLAVVNEYINLGGMKCREVYRNWGPCPYPLKICH